ncbi:MAG: nucleotide excision repair endonuclease, partial [Planctomycetes bacterium]|nr:nucleotide excision repair endonuclease [Planctomycetota bacterium]
MTLPDPSDAEPAAGHTEPSPPAETLPADTDAAAASRDRSAAAEKVRGFPTTPGVYLIKDEAGRVIYVGKAKNLRARAGSYFLKAAAEDRRTA